MGPGRQKDLFGAEVHFSEVELTPESVREYKNQPPRRGHQIQAPL